MSRQSESVLNGVLITMSRSFLQYVAEGWPWVDTDAQQVGNEVLTVAEQQRLDVAAIANLLNAREHFIDFGSFPTEYTDLQFLALGPSLDWINNSQEKVINCLQQATSEVDSETDPEAAELLAVVSERQDTAAVTLKGLREQLAA